MYEYHCKHFKTSRPCDFRKQDNTLVCNNSCAHYNPITKNVLIACLGAFGDVLSHSALFKHFPTEEGWQIHFLTMKKMAPILERLDCKVYYFDEPHTCYSLDQIQFDTIFSVDKDVNLVQYLSRFYAPYRYTYQFNGQKLYSENPKLQHELNLGWDDELFCREQKTRYARYLNILDIENDGDDKPLVVTKNSPIMLGDNINKLGIIGIKLTTSQVYCSNRTLSFEQHQALIGKLIEDYSVILLGGIKDHPVNSRMNRQFKNKLYDFTNETDASYQALCDITAACDIIITPDTLQYHIAKGLNKKIVSYYGPSKHQDFAPTSREIRIVHNDCGCFIPSTPVHDCWKDFDVNKIIEAVKKVQEL